MDKRTCYKIGFIMKPHGLKGQVTLSLGPEAPDDFSPVEALFVEVRERLLPYFVEGISLKGNKAYLKLEGVDTADDAQALARAAVYLSREHRPRPSPGTFYDDEIVGYEVTDENAGRLGEVTEVVLAGPNRLLSVTDGQRDVLIPVNGPFIVSVSEKDRRISVSLPDGFLDIG